MQARRALASLLRSMAAQIEAMGDERLADVLSGKLEIEVVVKPSRHRRRGKPRHRITERELVDTADAIRSCRTREEGEELLATKVTSKSDLSQLARNLDLPVQKSDSTEQLTAKIIEATIGFRLRSAAVQGTMKPKNNE